MSYTHVNTTNFAIRYGLLIALGCIIYFLIMRLFKLHFMVELSLLNGLIMVIGIFFTLKAFKKLKENHMKYLDGIKISFLTSAVAALAFGAFMALYGVVISDNFMEETNADDFFGDNLSLLTLFGYVVLELVISGFIAGFVFMQWFKSPDHKLSN